MDDSFLKDARREPRAAYARSLRERLRATEDAPVRGFRWQPLLATAAGMAVVAALFTVPAVRVAAQNALDVFRVREIRPVEVGTERLEQLKALSQNTGDDPMAMMFEKQDVQAPPKPVEYPSADLAASSAGLPGVKQPGALPNGFTFKRAIATGPGSARLIVHTARAQQLLDALDIRDVRVPSGLDGQSVTVHAPASVIQEYASEKRHLRLVEANAPEVMLPPGTDLQQLGEIGLRVLGLEAAEARRMAASIDWRSTLVFPVPMNAASFQKVTVNGNKGLLIRTRPESESPDKPGRAGTMVLWSEGGRVLALQSDLSAEDVMTVAGSLR